MDYLATSRDSFFHRASAISKMFFSATIIVAIVVSNSPFFLGALLFFLIFLLKLLGQPVLKILGMTLYVAVFAIIFAISQVAGPSLWPLVIVLKAITAALSVLTLLTTTNYFDIFAVFSRFLPKLIADSLFMTYRSFFILLRELSNSITAIKVKGGLSPRKMVANLRNLGGVLGVLLINAIDLSSRSSKILAIRGYKGGISKRGVLRGASRYDLVPLMLGTTTLLGVGFFG